MTEARHFASVSILTISGHIQACFHIMKFGCVSTMTHTTCAAGQYSSHSENNDTYNRHSISHGWRKRDIHQPDMQAC